MKTKKYWKNTHNFEIGLKMRLRQKNGGNVGKREKKFMKIKFSSDDRDLVVLVVVIIFIFGNLKDCLMKILQLLTQVIQSTIKLSWN